MEKYRAEIMRMIAEIKDESLMRQIYTIIRRCLKNMQK